MKRRGCPPNQTSLKLFAAALVCGLVTLPTFSQSSEEKLQKRPFKVPAEAQWAAARMVLPDSLKTDVVAFNRRRVFTGRVEFLPYRLNDLKYGLRWDDLRKLSDRAVEMALPDSLKTDVEVFDRSSDTTGGPLPGNFPPYAVSHLKHGLSWDEMFVLFDVKVEAPTVPRGFSFTLSEDKTEIWQVGCRWTPTPGDWSHQGRRHAVPANPEGIISIQCRLTPVGSDQQWALELETSALVKSDRARLRGRLTNGKRVYEVTPSYSEDLKFLDLVPLAGYLFAVDQEPVAAATSNRLIFRKFVAPMDRSLIAAAAYSLSFLGPLLDEAPADRGFSFTVSKDRTEIQRVACHVRGVADRLLEVDANTVMSIKCDLVSVGSDQHGTLELEVSVYAKPLSDETQSKGRLTKGKVVYEVRPSYEVKSHLGLVRLAGYLFIDDREPVAAATTSFMGQLIVRNSVAPADRSLIAAAASALILLTPRGVGLLTE